MNLDGKKSGMDDSQTRDGFAGGISATIISSICCIIPLVLLIIGVGVTAGLVISQYRPYFILAGLIFIGVYIFLYIRRKAGQCSCSLGKMAKKEEKFIYSTLLTFIAGLLVVNFLIVPLVSSIITNGEVDIVYKDNPQATTGRNLTAVKLSIDGMTCSSCASIIKDRLMKVDGVIRADICYKEKGGIVIFDPAYTSVDKIVEAIKPYKATIVSE